MSRILYGMAVMLLLGACSPVQRIAVNSNEIRNEAQALAAHGVKTQDTVVVSHAERIDDLASDIQVTLPGVEDKTPAWLSTLRWWGIAIAVVGIAFMVWNSGIGSVVRVAIGWLPRKKIVQAELAADMLDPSRPEGDREMISAMRASDREFDAAFRKAQERRKPKT